MVLTVSESHRDRWDHSPDQYIVHIQTDGTMVPVSTKITQGSMGPRSRSVRKSYTD